MISAAMLLALCVPGALLQVQSLPWTPGVSVCFPADLDLDGTAEVFVLEEFRLRAYGKGQQEPLFDRRLPPATSAFDVADIDGDDTAEVVAICGEEILALDLDTADPDEPRRLFTRKNQYSQAIGRPFPCVLVVDREGAPMIALPQVDTLEVRNLAGELAESYEVGVRAPNHLALNRPFSYWVNQHAQAGPASALEFRVSSVVSFRPLRTRDDTPVDIESATARPGTPRQQRDARQRAPEEWPWFAVGASSTHQFRGLYRAGPGDSASTTVCIRTAPLKGTPGAFKIGPPRHYPGNLVLRENRAPDFDGDGFTDLLLWKARQPSLTASSLARAATSKTWPLTLTAHAFLANKQRFEPKPMSYLTIEVPVSWWLLQSPVGPLRDLLLRDFDGDGKTDFGCFTDERTLQIWRAGEQGFGGAPAFEHRFPVPAGPVLLEADLEGLGSTTLAIESGDTLVVLRPISPILDF